MPRGGKLEVRFQALLESFAAGATGSSKRVTRAALVKQIYSSKRSVEILQIKEE